MKLLPKILLIAVALLSASIAFADGAATTLPTVAATTPSTASAQAMFPRAAHFSPATIDQLHRAGNALIDDAVKRPYGWAWENVPSRDPAVHRAPPVGMGRSESPAAGLSLLWVGTALDDSSFEEAARQSARAVAFSLARNGPVLTHPIFGTTAGGHDDRAFVPSRESTIAGLALLLAQLEQSDDQTKALDVQFHSAAIRATNWLIHQMAHNGAWPSGFPPGAADRDATKIVRLDQPDIRDATTLLFIAGEMLHLPIATEAAKKSAAFLTRTRLANPIHSSNLWGAACTVDGELVDNDLTFPNGADVVASRYAIQTLLIASCFEHDDMIDTSIERAIQTLTDTQIQGDTQNGKWQRYPDPGAYHRPATQRSRAGVPTQPAVKLPVDAADFGLATLLEEVSAWKDTDRGIWIAKQSADERMPTLRGRLLAMSVGLLDDPLIVQSAIPAMESSPDVDQTLQQRIAAVLIPLLSDLDKGRAN